MCKQIVFLAILFTSVCFGFTQNTSDTFRLKTVEIIDSREFSFNTKKSVDSLTEIPFLTGNSIELLNKFTSVHIREYSPGGISTISFRGTSASQTTVFSDGFSVNSAMSGQADLNAVVPFLFDNISVSNQFDSQSFSTDYIGGGISFNTEPPLNFGNTIKIKLYSGSFSTYGSGFLYEKKNRLFSFRSKLFYENSKNDFSFTNITKPGNPEERRINSSYSKTGISQDIFFNGKNTSGFIKLYALKNFNCLPAPIIQEQIDGNEKQTLQSIRLTGAVRKQKQQLLYSVRFLLGNEHWTYLNTKSDIHSDNKTYTYSGILNISGQSKLVGKISANYCLGSQTIISNNYQSIPQIFTQNLTLSAEKSTKILSWSMNAAFNWQSDYKLYFNPSILMFKDFFKSKQKFTFETGLKTRFPSFNDLYWYPGGNPFLRPERGYSAEFGSQTIINKNWKIQFTAFASKITNWIIWLPTENVSVWSPENRKKVLIKGIEFENDLKFSIFNSIIEYTLHGDIVKSLDISNPSGDEYQKQLIYVPVLNVSQSIEADFRYVMVDFSSFLVGKRYIQTDNELYMPSYNYHNVSIGRKFRKEKIEFSLYFTVQNIFGYQYQIIAWQPQQGRMFRVSLNFKFHEK